MENLQTEIKRRSAAIDQKMVFQSEIRHVIVENDSEIYKENFLFHHCGMYGVSGVKQSSINL